MILLYALFLIALAILYGTWSWGVVIVKTWLWAVVPTFHVEPLTFSQAVAISLCISVLAIKITPLKLYPENYLKQVGFTALLMVILMPWITLILIKITSLIFI